GPAGHGRRRALLLTEAERLLGVGDREGARRMLERALEYGEDRDALRRSATLAEEDERWADAEAALRQLAALGEPDAPLRRARAQLLAGDAAAARETARALGAA